MGTIAGALLGAAAIVITGRGWKGRDFLALAAALFSLALFVGFLLEPVMIMIEGTVEPDLQGTGVLKAGLAIIAGLIAFCVAYVPGLIFVARASPAKSDG